MTVLDILNELSATRKRTEKEDIIMKHHNNEDLREAARLAYDPRINFYMKKVPQASVFPLTHETRALMPLSQAMQHIELNLATRNVTGNEAEAYVADLLGSMHPNEATVLERIIKKDLRCGVGATTWEELFANFRIEPYMQCASMNEKNLSRIVFPAYAQTKLDGMYANCIIRSADEVQWLSRNGTELTVPADMTKHMLTLSKGVPGVYHGELVIEADGGLMEREDSNPLFSNGEAAEAPYADRVRFIVWDLIPVENYDEKTVYDVTYALRMHTLLEQCNVFLNTWYNEYRTPSPVTFVITTTVRSMDEAYDVFNEELARGGEGIVVKNLDSNWRDSKNPGWVKFKEVKEADLVVVGYKEGEGKYKGGIGSLLCQSSCGLLEVGVAGLTDGQRGFETVGEDIQLIEGFDLNMYTGNIMPVIFNAVIKNKEDPNKFSLFLPRVSKNKKDEIVFRTDKSVADTLEEIKAKKMGG